jgi:hypothetical protein
MVNAIKMLKDVVPIIGCIKSLQYFKERPYHNYKTLVINKCSLAFFFCAVLKQYPHELLQRNSKNQNCMEDGREYKY